MFSRIVGRPSIVNVCVTGCVYTAVPGQLTAVNVWHSGSVPGPAVVVAVSTIGSSAGPIEGSPPTATVCDAGEENRTAPGSSAAIPCATNGPADAALAGHVDAYAVT